jgi:hypothetical protein
VEFAWQPYVIVETQMVYEVVLSIVPAQTLSVEHPYHVLLQFKIY